MWIFARYAEVTGRRGRTLSMKFDRFKQYAWGASRSRRVFNQLSDFGIAAEFDDDLDGDGDYYVRFWFKGDEEGERADALQVFVRALLKRQPEDVALELFKRADMTIFV